MDPSDAAIDAATGAVGNVEFIELTNCGDTALDVDGALWYDDESGDPEDAAGSPIMGITSIGPNESVIAVNVDTDDGFIATTAIQSFLDEFPGFSGQVGFYSGSGLSSNPQPMTMVQRSFSNRRPQPSETQR